MADSTLQRQIEDLAPWFHNVHLPDGTQTNTGHPLGDFPSFKWRAIAPHLPANLEGWSALDIGCNAGFYSIELARRGARVLAIDMDPHYLAQARWCVEQWGLSARVSVREMQVYDLAGLDEPFDLVLFMGVFYHLRHPLLGLDIVARTVRSLLVFQSLVLPGERVLESTNDYRSIENREAMTDRGWPHMAFVEHQFVGDPTNWWVPNRAAVEAMLRSAGLGISQRIEREVYLCVRNAERAYLDQLVETELRAATGGGAMRRLRSTDPTASPQGKG